MERIKKILPLVGGALVVSAIVAVVVSLGNKANKESTIMVETPAPVLEVIPAEEGPKAEAPATEEEPEEEVEVEVAEEVTEAEAEVTEEIIFGEVGYIEVDGFLEEISAEMEAEYHDYELEQARESGVKMKGDLIIVSSSTRTFTGEDGGLYAETTEVYRDLDWNLYEFTDLILLQAPQPSGVIYEGNATPVVAQEETPVAPSPVEEVVNPAPTPAPEVPEVPEQGTVETYTDSNGETFDIIW